MSIKNAVKYAHNLGLIVNAGHGLNYTNTKAVAEIEHMNEFNEAVQIYQIPETMFYKPKLLSAELYGTTELWLAILRLNGMKNITEFHKPVIQIWEPGTLKQLIDVFFKREGIR